MELSPLTAAVAARSAWIEETLRQFVLIESPTEDPTAVNAAMELAASLARELGGRVKVHKQKHFGHIHELRFGPARSTRKPILLLGHLDTVWPLGTLKAMPWRKTSDRIYGPGVLDMKAGIVMAFAALSALQETGLDRPVTLLLNSEEETGSPVSRPITEQLARQSSAVFVLEPAQGLAYKTARKGVGNYRLEVTGLASHAGVDFDRGHSAILELARQIPRIAALSDPAKQRTVNCGVIQGGTRSNVVAAQASVEIDVRIARAADAATIDRLLRRLKPVDPHCTLTLTGGINRPPMERRPGTVALYKQARRLAAELGFSLDGMGAVGEGAHASHESILTEHLVPRTTLLAALLATV